MLKLKTQPIQIKLTKPQARIIDWIFQTPAGKKIRNKIFYHSPRLEVPWKVGETSDLLYDLEELARAGELLGWKTETLEIKLLQAADSAVRRQQAEEE